MKYAIIIPDGCADEPQESLGRQDAAAGGQLPAMDAVAAAGRGRPGEQRAGHLPAGSDVANLSLLGYDPTGTSPAGRRWKRPPRASNWGRTIGPFAAIW